MRSDGNGTPVARPKYWAMGWKSLVNNQNDGQLLVWFSLVGEKKNPHLPDLRKLNGEVGQEDKLRALPLLLSGWNFLLSQCQQN